MNKEIKLQIEKYRSREHKMDERIVELNNLEIKTPLELQELHVSRTLKVFWSIVIQDLRKIADKS